MKDVLPISIIEKQGFKQMLEGFDSRYQLPSRIHFSKTTILALLNTTQWEVDKFPNITDLWSSVRMYVHIYAPYLSYYIIKNWNLQSKFLQTLFIPGDNNGENLAEYLWSTGVYRKANKFVLSLIMEAIWYKHCVC